MGNRAVISAGVSTNSPCIYLHWNGGRASVVGLLKAARDLGFKGTTASDFDTLAALWAESFFECPVGQTIYREKYGQADTDNWDNGVYLINDEYEIVGRKFMRNREEYDLEKTVGICQQVVEFYGEVQ